MNQDRIGIINLNDCNLSLTIAGQSWHTAGFATLTATGAVFGEQAQQQARLQPLLSFNQFWDQLSLEAIHNGSTKFRHYADFAYHQLLNLRQQASNCQQVILAVPASFNREQLALLLGIFQQCAWQVIGLVDSGLAAIVDKASGNALYLDIQLHQCLLTQLSSNVAVKGKVTVKGSDIVTAAGLTHLYRHWATYLAEQFIAQCRFDPLHDAKTEQQLYDILPQLLNPTDDDLNLTLQGKQVKLKRQSLKRHSLALFEPLLKAIAQHPATDQLFISQRIAAIPEIYQRLNNPVIVDDAAIVQNCHDLSPHICNHHNQISLITSLPASQQQRQIPQPCTHFLLQDTAYPIGHKTLYISADSAISPSTMPNAKIDAQFALQPEHNTLTLSLLNSRQILLNGTLASHGAVLNHGDILSVESDGGSLKLINVVEDKNW
jgi:hypothetical protein